MFVNPAITDSIIMAINQTKNNITLHGRLIYGKIALNKVALNKYERMPPIAAIQQYHTKQKEG